jgi:predicted  nucleic acid-binding Zn-ribbon protein
MTEMTRAQMETLLSLQQIEMQKLEVRKVLDAVAAKVAALEKELSDSAKGIEKDRQALKALQERYRDYDEQIRVNTVLIEKIEGKRRSVKTNREYESLLKEEEQLRTRKAQVEEEMLACMSEIEGIEENIGRLEAEHRQLDEQVTTDKQAVKQEASESETHFADLSREVTEVEAEIAPELLKAFARIKKMAPDGKALAAARNSVCLGCHMNIPPQMFNELQRFDSLKLCPFCNRILYWDNGEDRG